MGAATNSSRVDSGFKNSEDDEDVKTRSNFTLRRSLRIIPFVQFVEVCGFNRSTCICLYLVMSDLGERSNNKFRYAPYG